jgi:TPR repeat protein
MNNTQRSSSWFLDQLAVFQTANSDYQSVKNNFIIRKTEFSTIVDSIQNKKAKDPLQHELILGRRGSGKSTLLKRIEIEVVENPRLNKKFVPINLAEEQAGIYRLFDLWEQVLEELKIQTKAEISIPEYAAFDDVQAYTRQLYNSIHDVCLQSKKRIILLLDNFDRIVENLDDDGSLLRETLINYNDIQIIAGSTRMDEHFWGYDKPFYEFFRRHRLEALSREEINLLLNHWSDSLEIPILRTFVKDNPGKIENIRLLTDGLPRTLQFFIQIVLQKSETSTYDYLKKTMDNVSPLFQERLNALTAPMRKIVLEMAFIWEACSTKQLVEKTRMESKLISANLSTLVDKGLVDKIETNKKQHLYRISERFFNMWLIVTQGNPEQKRKARWLSIFLENWYDATDFKRLTGEHISKLQNGETDWFQALVFSKALSQSKYLTTDERDTIIELTEKIRCKDIRNCMVELPEKFKSIIPKIEKYIDEKNYQKAIELAKGIENEADGLKFMLLGFLFAMKQNFEEAECNFLSAVAQGDSDGLFNLAFLYQQTNRYVEAEKYYLLAIEKGNVDSLSNLAHLYKKQKKFAEAEKYFQLSIEKGNVNSIFDLALLYQTEENYVEAEKYYLLAIENGDITSLFNLALLYDDQGKSAEAEKYYLLAIENGDVGSLNNLAILYKDQGKYVAAEKYLLEAVEKNHVNSLDNLAHLYKDQKRYKEAEKYYLLAIEKGNISSLFNLAVLCEDLGKYTEAEKYYLLAIEQGDSTSSFNLALLYQDQEKYAEAEKYYLLAIEKGDINSLNNLAVLCENQARYTEAEKYYLLAIEKGASKSAFNLALYYQDIKKYTEAEKYYLLAIEKGDNNSLNNLAYMFYEINDIKNKEKARELAEKALETNDDFFNRESLLIIELWNGIFNDVENRAIEIIKDENDKIIEELLFDLLVQQQKNLVLRLFQHIELGAQLQEKYMVLYYVTLLLTSPQDENLRLRIPPELQSTIDEVLEKIINEQKRYSGIA